MIVDLVGRINNVELSVGNVLLPVFDAIVNSIEAIEDAKIPNQDGRIKITVERDNRQTQIDKYGVQSNFPVSSFIIEDNGIGFNDDNFISFNTSDGQRKRERGGKGVGRFLWLKAFDEAHISSIYKQNGKTLKREFDFRPTNEEIVAKPIVINDALRMTSVYLKNLKEKYQKNCPIKLETIASKIIEHCLFYFLQENRPTITITDGETTLVLNEIYSEILVEKEKKESFKVKGVKFQIVHLKLKSSGNSHKIHYCAKGRDVQEELVQTKIPNLAKRIEEDGAEYWYAGYVFGEYLDNHVNSTRTDLIIPKEGHLEGFDELTYEELNDTTMEIVKKFFSQYIEKVNIEKKERIQEFTQNNAVEYRQIVKHNPELLETIRPDVSDEQLEIELHKVKTGLEITAMSEVRQILSEKPQTAQDLEEYTKKINETLKKVNILGQAELSKYIVHRRVILEIFCNNLNVDPDMKYKYEEALHQIIFPLRTTSDDISPEQQNLWLIDERLAYHFYLASDKELRSCEPLSLDSSKEPDLIIFNHSFALVDEDAPYGSIVIIEFKRPQRNDYTGDKNPVDQIYNYIDDIKTNKVTDKNGRPIMTQKGVPFYAYVIADITPTLDEVAKRRGLIKTPDNMGYYGYTKDFDVYIEIISHTKLLSDAKKRNQILFDKLNLPKF